MNAFNCWRLSFRGQDEAQDGFDYLLTGGVIAVLFAAGMIAFRELVPEVVGRSCDTIDYAATAPGEDDCLTEAP